MDIDGDTIMEEKSESVQLDLEIEQQIESVNITIFGMFFDISRIFTDRYCLQVPTIHPVEEIRETTSDQTENVAENPSEKVIPRLVNNASVPLDILSTVDPENWTTSDVAKFLTVNDCQTYCVNFNNITGSTMLQLSKDEIIELLEMKVGPSLKIYDLIQQLKCKIKQPQSRLSSNFK